jgi:hypothetical protein
MTSAAPGARISEVEVGSVEDAGLTLRLREGEVRLAYDDFPRFRGAAEAKLRRVERLSERHLYWPDLDVDLHVESLFHPERFPLVASASR